MTDTLALMGLSPEDFTWYEAGLVDDFVDRDLPQMFGELAVENEPLTVAVVNQVEAIDYTEMKMAFIFRGLFLPVYEDGEFYVKPDGSFATLKRNDGFALLGVRNAS
ncbi:hypothetical protein [Vibrio harveyi]|uniref:hypothetical protein n=1 Tax=Vibrio harveyi TaxID=669 RepID=UPI003CF693FF